MGKIDVRKLVSGKSLLKIMEESAKADKVFLKNLETVDDEFIKLLDSVNEPKKSKAAKRAKNKKVKKNAN